MLIADEGLFIFSDGSFNLPVELYVNLVSWVLDLKGDEFMEIV